MGGRKWYACEIHRPEGLAVVRRVLRSARGEASYRNGILSLDQLALDDLVHLGTVSDDNGAVVYADDSGCVNMHGVPRIRFGRDLYPVIESP